MKKDSANTGSFPISTPTLTDLETVKCVTFERKSVPGFSFTNKNFLKKYNESAKLILKALIKIKQF